MLATRPDIVGEEVAPALEHLQDRLPPFPRKRGARRDRARLRQAGGGAVLQLSARRWRPPPSPRCIAPRPATTPPVRGGGESAAARHSRASSPATWKRLALFARMRGTLFGRSAAPAPHRAGGDPGRRRWRWNWICAWKPPRRPNFMNAPAARAEFRVPHIDWSRTAATRADQRMDRRHPHARCRGASRAAGRDPKTVALLVMRSFLTQALRDGFFHADMHPGNLFVDAQGRLVAVDFGIMGRLDARHAPLHGGHAGGLPGARLSQGGGSCITNSPSCRRSIRSRLLPRRCAPSASRFSASSARDVSIARLLGQLFETTRRFDMQAQPQLVLLQKTMVVVEGVAAGWIRISTSGKRRGRWPNAGSANNMGPEARAEPRRRRPSAPWASWPRTCRNW